jgi:predicted PurR-regulated permease PerM
MDATLIFVLIASLAGILIVIAINPPTRWMDKRRRKRQGK